MKAPARRVLAAIDLVQDFDVLAPILTRLSETPELDLRIVVSDWLARRAPRIALDLRLRRLAFDYVKRSDLLGGSGPGLDGTAMLLTASESSAGPHRWVRALVERANRAGLGTFTVQHGLDNLQTLAVADGAGPPPIASDVLFCWPPEERLPDDLPPRLRARLACVGRARLEPPARLPTFDLAVFENLHAKAYAEADRDLVLERLLGLAQARPSLAIYVRAHPAGGWLDHARGRLSKRRNLTFVPSRAARRALEDGSAVAALARRVITTPSTIALDAVQAGRPVALALDGGALFSPLPVLGSLDDWIAFADAPAGLPDGQAGFFARHVRAGDAAGRIVEQLVAWPGKSDA